MPIREILQLGNPILWEQADPVAEALSADTKSLVDDLRDTLRAFRQANGYGRGIAAPQIGSLKQVIYISMPSGEFDGPLINPEIVWEDNQRMVLWDACFSLPNLMVKVSRAAGVEVKYTDISGSPSSLKADGDLSELLQHEIDHLDGILALQRAVSSYAFATRDEWLRMQKK